MTREAAADAARRLERLKALLKELETDRADSEDARRKMEELLREIDRLRTKSKF